MSIQAGDILRIVAVMAWLDGDIAQNVFNAVVTGGGSPFSDADIVADAKAWLDSMYATMTGEISNQIDGSEVRVYVYDSVDDDWDEVGSDTWGWNPSETNEPVPRGVSILINAKTLDPDVSGKKYLAGMTIQDIDDSLLTPAIVANAVLFAAEWYSGFVGGTSGADWVPGIWSPTRTSFLALNGTILVPTIPAYQRRRKQGVGI